jgi:hypothetical protein
MLRYLYIPENEDLDEHINFAVHNNFHQIIHGESDIVSGLIKNIDSVQEINIPEYRMLDNDFLVFHESEDFKIRFIDEFAINSGYDELTINLYQLDENNLKNKNFILSKKMNKINKVFYEIDLSIDKFGEYEFTIVSAVNNKEDKILFTDRIIIYKQYKEDNSADDKFFFTG